MSNFKQLHVKSNKENFINTPNKVKRNNKTGLCIEETPTPLMNKKVLKLTTAQKNNNSQKIDPFSRKKVLDTPPISSQNGCQKQRNV